MLERGEIQSPPAAQLPEEHGEVPEHLVPALALRREPPQLRVEALHVGLRIQLRRRDRLGLIEECPLRRLLLQPFLDGLELRGGRWNQAVRRYRSSRSLVHAQVFLAHRL